MGLGQWEGMGKYLEGKVLLKYVEKNELKGIIYDEARVSNFTDWTADYDRSEILNAGLGQRGVTL